MSLNNAKEHLKKYHLENNIIIFDDTSATVSEAAKRLNCEESEIAKTLAFLVKEQPILILMAGNAKCKNSLFKQNFYEKAKMIPASEVEDIIDHPPGGVCPFGIKEGVEVYLDESLKEHEIIYPACGTPNSAVKLTIEQLENSIPNHKWINVSKDINEN